MIRNAEFISTCLTHGLRERYSTHQALPKNTPQGIFAHRLHAERKATAMGGSARNFVAEVGRPNSHLDRDSCLVTFPLKTVGTRLLTVSIHGAGGPAVAFDLLLPFAAAADAASSSLSEDVTAAAAGEKKASSSATDVSPAVLSGNCPSLDMKTKMFVQTETQGEMQKFPLLNLC